jgi:Membrane-associated sensor, integral membrane domain
MFMERSAAGPGAHEFVLSNLSPSVAQRRLALGVVLVLLVVFVIVAGPLSALPLRRIDAFIPAYGTAIFVTDLITAALLFAQFSILRSRALLALANGYLLTALIAIPWTLTFPGVFAPGGGLGAGLQSTVWLYVLSHAGFGLFAIIYTLLKDADPIEWLSPRSVRAAILASVGSVTALVCCATVLVTAGHALLPRLHARHAAGFPSLVLRDRTHGGIDRPCACLAMAAAPLGARSLADGGLVRIHHRDRPHRFSCPDPL